MRRSFPSSRHPEESGKTERSALLSGKEKRQWPARLTLEDVISAALNLGFASDSHIFPALPLNGSRPSSRKQPLDRDPECLHDTQGLVIEHITLAAFNPRNR
jgi:hypothetical protein